MLFVGDSEGLGVAAGEIDDDEVDAGTAVPFLDFGFDDEVEVEADGELGFEGAHFEGDAADDVAVLGDG